MSDVEEEVSQTYRSLCSHYARMALVNILPAYAIARPAFPLSTVFAFLPQLLSLVASESSGERVDSLSGEALTLLRRQLASAHSEDIPSLVLGQIKQFLTEEAKIQHEGLKHIQTEVTAETDTETTTIPSASHLTLLFTKATRMPASGKIKFCIYNDSTSTTPLRTYGQGTAVFPPLEIVGNKVWWKLHGDPGKGALRLDALVVPSTPRLPMVGWMIDFLLTAGHLNTCPALLDILTETAAGVHPTAMFVELLTRVIQCQGQNAAGRPASEWFPFSRLTHLWNEMDELYGSSHLITQSLKVAAAGFLPSTSKP
jgi:hypothetical protein